ncbi:LOW QUALITY PROTEIN: UPF0081 domain-containing protein, partial [Cephalotus follicularis]
KIRAVSSLEEFPPNALRRKKDPWWRGGFSLGVDLGFLCSHGVTTIFYLLGGLHVKLLNVNSFSTYLFFFFFFEMMQEADEFIIGLTKSIDGKETPQSNKVRSVAGRLAVRAADRSHYIMGWRVYLQDEHGTSTEATGLMIDMGLNKFARHTSNDAYVALVLLERYFSMSGEETEIVMPKDMDLQEKFKRGAPKDIDFLLE